MIGGVPPFAVERGQGDAAPAQPRVCDGLARLDAHDDSGVFLDLPDLPELDVIAEARHQRWLHPRASQKTGVDAREEKEQRAAHEDGPERDGYRSKAEGSREPALLMGLRGKGWPDGSLCASPHFQPDECSHAEQQKKKKEHEKRGVHGKDSRGENRSKGEHRQEKRVAVRGRAVQPHDHDVKNEMDGPQQCRVERRVRRRGDKRAREKKHIKRKKKHVTEDQPGRSARRNFRGTPAPPANALIQDGRRSEYHRKQVEFTGADESRYGSGQEQKKRDAQKKLGGRWGGTRG